MWGIVFLFARYFYFFIAFIFSLSVYTCVHACVCMYVCVEDKIWEEALSFYLVGALMSSVSMAGAFTTEHPSGPCWLFLRQSRTV